MLRASPQTRPPNVIGERMRPTPAPVVDMEEYRHRVRVKRVYKPDTPTGPELKVLTDQVMANFSEKFKLRVSGALKLRALNQYVRCVLGKDGLESHLLEMVKRRQRRKSREGVAILFERAWTEELRLLVVQARYFVDSAEETEDITRRGHLILRGVSLRGRFVFITLHEKQGVVVGIYSGSQWNHRLSFNNSRLVSHRKAQAYRLGKALLGSR